LLWTGNFDRYLALFVVAEWCEARRKHTAFMSRARVSGQALATISLCANKDFRAIILNGVGTLWLVPILPASDKHPL
jgi:hypothetical protein